MMRLLVVVLIAAGATLALLPPRAIVVPSASGQGPPAVRGVMHVHSNRSDGTGSPDEVAAAAARAGLAFVIVTDHGDGTRRPDPPQYRHGVLYLDAVEISSDAGHVVGLGLPEAPFPLGGDPRDIIEDVARLNGVSIVAHPTSPQPSLRWDGGDAPFDGLEWLNGDSEWRDETIPTLAAALLTYWIRPAESIAALLDRPVEALALWDRLARTRTVLGVAAADTHARIGFRQAGEPYDGRPVLRVPGYESVFRAFSIHLPAVQLTGDATRDADQVLQAIRAGQVVSVIEGIGGPGWLRFTGRSGRHQAEQGGTLPIDGPVILRVESPPMPGGRIRVLRDGEEINGWDATGAPSDVGAPQPGAYRVEVSVTTPGFPPVPWLISNPIYVGRQKPAPAPSEPPDRLRRLAVFPDEDGRQWSVERSARADGAVTTVGALGGTQVTVRFALGGSQSEGAFVAAARALTPPATAVDSLVFTARAARPMRVAVQLRSGSDATASRWRRSVYLDETARSIRLPFSAFTPVGHTTALAPGSIGSLLFVVDTVNSALGSSGQFWLDEIAFASSAGPQPTLTRVDQVRTDSSK